MHAYRLPHPGFSFSNEEEVNGVLKAEIIGSRRQRLFERRILAGNLEARNCLFAGN